MTNTTHYIHIYSGEFNAQGKNYLPYTSLASANRAFARLKSLDYKHICLFAWGTWDKAIKYHTAFEVPKDKKPLFDGSHRY